VRIVGNASCGSRVRHTVNTNNIIHHSLRLSASLNSIDVTLAQWETAEVQGHVGLSHSTFNEDFDSIEHCTSADTVLSVANVQTPLAKLKA
jgi:hypothetical protein